MNISPFEHKSICYAIANLDARDFLCAVSGVGRERCAHICLAPSQNPNVWRSNIHVWTHFEPISSLRVHGWIQTTVSQLAGVRGCRRKRQLSFLYNVSSDVAKTSISNFRRVGTAFSGELPQARTVLLFGSYSGQIFPRRNLLTRRRK